MRTSRSETIRRVLRDFDVFLSEAAVADLFEQAEQNRRQIIYVLERLQNDDLFDCHAILGWPRGLRGSWIFHERSGWAFLAQWDQGRADLWPMGLGRGALTVEAIKPAGYAERLLSMALQPT